MQCDAVSEYNNMGMPIIALPGYSSLSEIAAKTEELGRYDVFPIDNIENTGMLQNSTTWIDLLYVEKILASKKKGEVTKNSRKETKTSRLYNYFTMV